MGMAGFFKEWLKRGTKDFPWSRIRILLISIS